MGSPCDSLCSLHVKHWDGKAVDVWNCSIVWKAGPPEALLLHYGVALSAMRMVGWRGLWKKQWCVDMGYAIDWLCLKLDVLFSRRKCAHGYPQHTSQCSPDQEVFWIGWPGCAPPKEEQQRLAQRMLEASACSAQHMCWSSVTIRYGYGLPFVHQRSSSLDLRVSL